MALQNDLFGLVPVAVLHRTLQICAMVAVQILKDPVLIFQATIHPLLRRWVLNCSKVSSLRASYGGGGRDA